MAQWQGVWSLDSVTVCSAQSWLLAICEISLHSPVIAPSSSQYVRQPQHSSKVSKPRNSSNKEVSRMGITRYQTGTILYRREPFHILGMAARIFISYMVYTAYVRTVIRRWRKLELQREKIIRLTPTYTPWPWPSVLNFLRNRFCSHKFSKVIHHCCELNEDTGNINKQ